MGSHRTDVGARVGVLRVPGWTVIAGLTVVCLASAPIFLRAQDAATDETAASAPAGRPGDAAAFRGWLDVNFPHDFHIDDLEIPCEDCHHETNAARLVMPHDEYFDDFWIDCRICHRGDGEVTLDPQDCGDCHHSAPGDTADETLSAKVVIHLSCWECHDSGTGVEAAEGCSFCHTSPVN